MTLRPFLLERFFARYEFQPALHLASSDCESLTIPELLAFASAEDLSAWGSMKLGYTETAGHPELRSLIANDYGGIDVITAVPEEAIYLTMRALLKPGDKIVATCPGYQSLYEIAVEIGCDVQRWSPKESSEGWHFDPSDLKLDGVKALVVNFPHNPTGAHPTAAEWAEVCELAERCGCWLISDEMYRGLETNSASLKAAASAYSKGVSIAGLSKAYGLAGLRCGWVATQDKELMAAIQRYKDYTTICASAPTERLSIIAMKSGELLRKRCRDIIAANLPVWEDFVARHTHVLAARGVMLLPSKVYEAWEDHFRVGLGRLNFGEALNRLEKYIKMKV
ncbi:MAG: aminotransferase class I/II-fold pyridoxal phosphate-dependent enzyme [Acidobacteria bacterium]|nr:aminotransferase class I/II-fold pyridoxal phosphate-dependent enzyme [Acidobacteriota bacterium]